MVLGCGRSRGGPAAIQCWFQLYVGGSGDELIVPVAGREERWQCLGRQEEGI